MNTCVHSICRRSHKLKVESGKGRSGVVLDWLTKPHTKYTVEPDGGNLLVIVDLLVCVSVSVSVCPKLPKWRHECCSSVPENDKLPI